MNDVEQQAALSLALMAALADGDKNERERSQLRSVAEAIGARSAIDLAPIYRDVLLKKASLDDTVRALTAPETRQLAYEMAVCVCDADGARNDAERDFLARLAGKLHIAPAAARAFAEGKLGGKAGRQATSSAFSFATTYALGHVAKRCYADARTLTAASLKSSYSLAAGGSEKPPEPLFGRDRRQARTIDLKQLAHALRA